MSSSSANDRRRPDGTLDIDPRAIDTRLMDGLIARHGEPRPARPLSRQQIELRERRDQRDRLLEAADPSLLDHLHRHDRDADEFDGSRKLDPDLVRAPAELARFDLDAWRLLPAGEEREIEPAPEVLEALAERTPPAILRDLHRPVRLYGDIQLVPSAVPTGSGQLRKVRNAVGHALQTVCGAAGKIGLASHEGRKALAELGDALAQPWQDSRPENPLPMARRAPSSEDWQWFGVEGGYDPDV